MTTGHLLAPLSLPARQVLWIAYGFLAGFVLSSQRWRKPGGNRLSAALPLLLLNLFAPLLFDGDTETLANFSCAIATAFISNLKASGRDAGRAAAATQDHIQNGVTLTPLPAAHPKSSALPLGPDPQLLGWIMGRGSLVSPTLSPAQFAAVYTLPITPAAGEWLQVALQCQLHPLSCLSFIAYFTWSTITKNVAARLVWWRLSAGACI